jgi:hypothetical protein
MLHSLEHRDMLNSKGTSFPKGLLLRKVRLPMRNLGLATTVLFEHLEGAYEMQPQRRRTVDLVLHLEFVGPRSPTSAAFSRRPESQQHAYSTTT